jgi:mannose-6-phosphate isomerase-like protein (cupin superfamily)
VGTVFRKGAELYDERFGERYVLLETAEGTGGELVRIEDSARPGPSRRPASAHPRQEERFEVVSGTLGLTVDGEEERLLGPGESFAVRAGARHLPRNAGEGELRFVAEIRPAGRFEEFLAEITAANNSGREGLAYLLTVARVLHRFPDVERPTPLPRPLERALFALLAAAGGLLGLRAASGAPDAKTAD